MQTLLVMAVPALVLGILGCGWRAFELLSAWRPATATVLTNDYDEAQQQDDRWGMGTLRGWHPLVDGRGARMIEETVRFDDQVGARHVAQIRRRVLAGRRPDDIHRVWYHKADAQRVTAFGPGYWLMTAVMLALALATIVNAGLQLRR